MATVFHINSTKNENISATQEGSIGVLLASCVEIILCLLGTFGNSLTISVIWRTKSLQVASNFLLASLAFADLLVSVILVPMRASQHMAFYYGVTVPGTVVEIAGFVGRVNIIASISSLTVMSIDRYIALHHPLFYLTSVKFAKGKTCFVISCIWACSIVVTSVPKFPGVKDKPFLVFFVTFVLMATLIITVVYYKIFKVARKAIRRHPVVRLSRTTTSHDSSPSVQHDTQANGQKKERKTAATIAFVIGVFVALVYPRIVLILYHFATPETPESRLARFWIRILLYSNSVMNPALYVWRHKEFKREFMKTLLRIWQCLRCRELQNLSKNSSSKTKSASVLPPKKESFGEGLQEIAMSD